MSSYGEPIASGMAGRNDALFLIEEAESSVLHRELHESTTIATRHGPVRIRCDLIQHPAERR